MSAPANDSSPPTTHARYTSLAEPTACIIGKITFGEYNVNTNRTNGEVAAQWLFEASDLNKRAIELDNAGRYSEAEPLYQQSLAMHEEVLGLDHPDVAVSLNNLAFLYGEQRRYAEAEPLYKRSLAIKEKAFGPDHQDVALSLNNLATLINASVVMPMRSHCSSDH